MKKQHTLTQEEFDRLKLLAIILKSDIYKIREINGLKDVSIDRYAWVAIDEISELIAIING